MSKMRIPSTITDEEVEEESYRTSEVPSSTFSQGILPKTKRKSTDCCWAILIILMWITMTIVGLAAIGKIPSSYIKKGDPNYLLHGVDYEGNICGVSAIVSHLPKQVYPNYYGTNLDSKSNDVPSLTAICVSSCPAAGQIVSDPYGNYGSWTIPENTVDFVNTCLYAEENRVLTSGTTILSDILNTYVPIALLGFVLAMGLSFLFLFITRIPMLLRSVVWGFVGFICLIGIGGGYFLILEAKHQDERSSNSSTLNETEVQLLNFLGISLCILGVLWLCITCFLRKRIALAIQIIRESAAALIHMPLLLVLPLFQTMLFAAFTCLWLYYAVYLVSSGEIETHVDSTTGLSYKTISYDENSQRAIVFLFGAWLWTIGFLEAMGQIASAHCVLKWYFAEVRREITSCQIFASMGCMMRYHLGTAAFGSLLIALIRGVRMILEYMRYHTAKMMQASTSGSTIASCGSRMILCVFSCFSCCLGCFEKFVKYLNKHAYIQTAMKGSSFLISAMSAFKLFVKNLGRFAAVTVIGDLVVLIGKLSISFACAAIGYLYFTTCMTEALNGFVLPTVFIFFVAYFTATMFLGVLSATADTLLQACLVDEEYIHSGKADQYHSTLKELVIGQAEQWKSDTETYDYYEDEEFFLNDNETEGYEDQIELMRYRASLQSSGSSISAPSPLSRTLFPNYRPLPKPPLPQRSDVMIEEEMKEGPTRSPWLQDNNNTTTNTTALVPRSEPNLYNDSLAWNPGARNNRYGQIRNNNSSSALQNGPPKYY